MRFEFSEETHKWCPQCGGNIRKEATWCRYCHKNISSRFHQEQQWPPFHIVRCTMIWLAGLDELSLNCSPGFREKFQIVRNDEVARFIDQYPDYDEQIRDSRTKSLCDVDPPEKQMLGLLQDILLSLHECGEDMQQICSEPRLVLLEITPSMIANESALRQSEESGANRCKFCQEFIFANQVCRFCGSDGIEPPKPPDRFLAHVAPPDLNFLKAVLLWEAAKRQSGAEEPFSGELFARYEITSAMIEAEILRQSQDSSAVPLLRWRRRMQELNLDTGRSFPELHIDDLTKLAQSCSWIKQYDEAEIILKHGLSLVGNYKPMRMCKYRLLDDLANHYFLRNDHENHRIYKGQLSALRATMVPEPQRKIQEESRQETEEMLKRISEPQENLDPKERVRQAEERMKKVMDRHAQMEEHEGSPEILQIMQVTKSVLNQMVGKKMEVSKLRIDAAEAKKAGDFEKAFELFVQALSMVGDEASDVLTCSSIHSSLADIRHLQGQDGEAEAMYQKAIAIAEELIELNEGKEHMPLGWACHSYARFLFELKRYSEAEANFLRALEMDQRFHRKFDIDFQRSTPSASEREAIIREELAKVMRCTDRISEADKLESEAIEIRRNAEEQERLRKEKAR